jgi:transmembrane sensor
MVRAPVHAISDKEDRMTEAALWAMRSRELDPASADALDRWLVADEANMEAYADSLLIWEALEQVAPVNDNKPGVTRRRLFELAAAACIGAIGLSVYSLFFREATYNTAVGDTRTVKLSDGTRLTLNTDTVVRVRYSPGKRRVVLVRGEALFDVSHNPNRPFSVEAAGEFVHALGTSFSVRRGAGRVDVTLLSGSVRVDRGDTDKSSGVILVPGERLRKRNGIVELDRPQLDVVTAWREGELILDDTPLTEAVAEMNRYSARPIVLESGSAGGVRLSGVYKTGESRGFSTTVAAIYGLKTQETSEAFVISGEISGAK